MFTFKQMFIYPTCALVQSLRNLSVSTYAEWQKTTVCVVVNVRCCFYSLTVFRCLEKKLIFNFSVLKKKIIWNPTLHYYHNTPQDTTFYFPQSRNKFNCILFEEFDSMNRFLFLFISQLGIYFNNNNLPPQKLTTKYCK